MHEVGIVQNVLDMAVAAAERQNASRIHVVRMRVGEMSGVVPDALEFAFEVLRAGTMAAEATLEVERSPVVCYCAACDAEFQSEAHRYECPRCREPTASLRGGQELEVVSLEVS